MPTEITSATTIWRNGVHRYGSLSIALHWFMLMLIAAVYACIELRELFPKGSDPREALKSWHFMLGLSVFGLAWLRLALARFSPAPAIEPAPARWVKLSASIMHVALYVLMIGLPLLGWLMLSASGKPIPFYGLQLPALLGENKGLAELFKEIHETGATAGYFLIGLHAAAALYHHYIVGDDTLRRILPQARR